MIEFTPRQFNLVAEAGIPEHGFDKVLAVVEMALNCDRVNIFRIKRRHLPLLHRRNLAVREQDKDVGAGACRKSVNRGPARIARRRADNGGAPVTFCQCVVHQPREQLHRHVLEGQCRTVEQFQREAVVSALHERRDRAVAEGRVGIVDHCLKRVIADFAADKGLQDAKGDFLIGFSAQSANVIL